MAASPSGETFGKKSKIKVVDCNCPDLRNRTRRGSLFVLLVSQIDVPSTFLSCACVQRCSFDKDISRQICARTGSKLRVVDKCLPCHRVPHDTFIAPSIADAWLLPPFVVALTDYSCAILVDVVASPCAMAVSSTRAYVISGHRTVWRTAFQDSDEHHPTCCDTSPSRRSWASTARKAKT